MKALRLQEEHFPDSRNVRRTILQEFIRMQYIIKAQSTSNIPMTRAHRSAGKDATIYNPHFLKSILPENFYQANKLKEVKKIVSLARKIKHKF